MAWVNMLLHIAKRDHNRAAFDKWPLALTNHSDMLEGMSLKVLKLIHNDAYKLWYTDLGYISSSEGILANGDEPQALRRALYEVQVSVVYLPDTLLHIVQNSNVMGRLNPGSLCTRLERSRSKVREAHENTKRVLLEYILSDPSFCQYGAVELFPLRTVRISRSTSASHSCLMIKMKVLYSIEIAVEVLILRNFRCKLCKP